MSGARTRTDGESGLALDLFPPEFAAARREAVRLAHAGVRDLAPPVVGLGLEHLGWTVDEVPTAFPGKGVRSLLCLVATAMVGGDAAPGAAPAACVELVHESTLVHDDLMDGDRLRRGRPAIWSTHGISLAVLLGIELSTAALRVLQDEAPQHLPRLTRRWSHVMRDLVGGQTEDLRVTARGGAELDVAEAERVAEGKTGALLGAALAMGAVAGGADDATADAFDRVGRQVGVAYQIADDLLALWGSPEVTGKPTQSNGAVHPLAVPADARSRAKEHIAAVIDDAIGGLDDLPDRAGVRPLVRGLLTNLGNREW